MRKDAITCVRKHATHTFQFSVWQALEEGGIRCMELSTERTTARTIVNTNVYYYDT